MGMAQYTYFTNGTFRDGFFLSTVISLKVASKTLHFHLIFGLKEIYGYTKDNLQWFLFLCFYSFKTQNAPLGVFFHLEKGPFDSYMFLDR